jgi:hypothetical protein
MLKFIAGYIWTQIQTTIHRSWVLFNIVSIIDELDPPDKWKLYRRGWKHDLSKYRWDEASYFAKTIFDLKRSTYGSDEYKEMLESIQPAIKVHYERNSHHPEHYKNGVQDMSELDKLEMICDWQAATRRHATGDIYKSIEINQKRFGYDDETKEWLISIAKIID